MTVIAMKPKSMIKRANFLKNNLSKSNHHQGFTLLEVLIAIAIFSVISLASFSIFQTVLNSDTATKTRTERMNELQRGFLIIERDMLQIARRSMRINGEAPQTNFLHTGNESFSSNEQVLAFVRNGWTNPALLLPRSDLQSVAYQLNDTVLERVHFNFVDAVLGETPKVRPLISQVEKLDFEFYDGKKWQKTLPNNASSDNTLQSNELTDNALPLAIAIELDTKDYGIIRREFLVAGDGLQVKGQASGNN